MILPAQAIRKLQPIAPFYERTVSHGMTFGLGPAGYDIRVAEDITLWPVTFENLLNNWLAKKLPMFFKHRPSFCLASTPEYFTVPDDLTFKVEDKSSYARRGLSVFNTTAEPGWEGYLTLELKNQGEDVIRLKPGMPIAQAAFHRLEEATETPYQGRYQNQKAGPQPALHARDGD